ncbi:hypothetical protein EV643_103243 [Kribbella sp. VKM Ac-2527]|uniref:Uncharacterized protein n=1 Tax=Kribbella caucasensis TaxID=2512215 RepID=A0A4R6KJL8_9ACTN|nr:hypothetical protein [Kribbella sp. VKM Ac-2527]TDO51504.1 hypothetical protein EV643_103243 [Kribbella sp. VKM Ac-2527]
MANGAHVVILSGGYGLLRAEELIGWYEKKLRLADWPAGLLENALTDEAVRVRAQWVVALASTTTDYARLIRRVPWSRTDAAEALLVTLADAGAGAMVNVPRALGQAFRAFWEHRPDGYPPGLVVERIS